MVTKFDDEGNTVWSRQICEDDFKSSGFSVCYDDQYAYIFFTQDPELDENYQVIPGSGGMFVMCVSISDEQPSAINEMPTDKSIVNTRVYTIDGKLIDQPQQGINIIRTTDENGVVNVKKVLKR